MTTEDVLKLLHAAPAETTGEALCGTLGLRRAAVRNAVRELRQVGYDIAGSLRTGLKLMPGPDRLELTKIAACIPCHPWLEKVQIFDTLDSTNTYAKQLALDGAASGTVIFAETQSAGRGRLGRSFSSEPGGLYMSVILRPEGKPEEFLHLTAAVAVAAMRAIEESCGVRADIKWTNDLVISGRKVCGILTELSAGAVIVGVGINCNQTALAPEIADMAATLSAEAGALIDRNILAANLIHAFFALSETLFSHKENWLRRFRERCITVGQDVKLVRGDEVRFAHAESVGPDGALIVCLPDGSTEAVASGEVSVRGMYGYADNEIAKPEGSFINMTNEVLTCLKARRSCRHYSDHQVEEEALSAILEAATYAASGMGRQSGKIVVLQDPEDIAQLERMNAAIMGSPDAHPFYGAPTVCVVFADSRVPTYQADGALVMGNLLNAACSVGVASCWIHRAQQEFASDEGKALMKKWGIDENYVGIGHCILGYAATKPAAPKPRKADFIVRV